MLKVTPASKHIKNCWKANAPMYAPMYGYMYANARMSVGYKENASQGENRLKLKHIAAVLTLQVQFGLALLLPNPRQYQ